ncbi:hypothetical protein CROQUDRAFT_673093 [Cronartium quercuum f. sp. fusiforme G11]|uniref:Fatty acid hydroxylase domain-containing protein n=1 Tax=Cronartium quercuum f. sp. fusiforme G11 TaxID=708437 RepID=A0A9P6NGL5_9BASI|nr:hypothetical protein CROQUDRAFT_673093 [Cronartium quercuum f. sp. fusiforme G11]
MDIILQTADELFLDCFWSSAFPIHSTLRTTSTPSACLSRFARDEILRQSISIFFLTFVGIFVLYFTLSTFSYYFVFDHRVMDHPRFLKNQIKLEICSSLKAFAPMDALTLPWFLAEVRGHSRVYNNVSDIQGLSISPILKWTCQQIARLTGTPHLADRSHLIKSFLDRDLRFGGGWMYIGISFVFFLCFTDFTIYLIHRWEHSPAIYKRIHKAHHKWVIPTPFASYAFHPVDGFLQSVPYHIFIFLFPLHKRLYLALFIFVTFWSILIHDSELIVNHPLEQFINGPSHHTLHHLHFTCNYGQYFTWADRLGSTYRHPVNQDHSDLLRACKPKGRWLPSPSLFRPTIDLLSPDSSSASCRSSSPDELDPDPKMDRASISLAYRRRSFSTTPSTTTNDQPASTRYRPEGWDI